MFCFFAKSLKKAISTERLRWLLLSLKVLGNLVLGVDINIVTNKDQSISINDIHHFEEFKNKLFQERSNIDASLA